MTGCKNKHLLQQGQAISYAPLLSLPNRMLQFKLRKKNVQKFQTKKKNVQKLFQTKKLKWTKI